MRGTLDRLIGTRRHRLIGTCQGPVLGCRPGACRSLTAGLVPVPTQGPEPCAGSWWRRVAVGSSPLHAGADTVRVSGGRGLRQ